jgi:RNA-directed DNA polymerase
MSPTQQHARDFLFDKATSRYALNVAWLHVRPRVEHSKDSKIRADAAAFATNVSRSVSQLQTALRGFRFKFEPQKGILKKRKTEVGQPYKEPRPIVVAPARNRIVQRAILDVCQSDDKVIRRKLGNLVNVIEQNTSVGGLPNRGVPEAIRLITGAIAEGANWYVRSDLKNFFQAVPKDRVRAFLNNNIESQQFTSLFMDALSTELSNEDEVRDLMRLFPIGHIGVPQGSALSALCANIVLSDFDLEFNGRGITTIRYLDDFVMLGKGKKSTEAAFRSAESLLEKSGFYCHSPFEQASAKASAGAVTNGFEFLSFKIAPGRIAPARAACNSFVEDVTTAIRSARAEIQSASLSARRSEPKYIQTLGLLDRKIRGWGDAFRPTTERLVFAQLDERIRKELEKFEVWFAKYCKSLDKQQRQRAIGIALLVDTPVCDHKNYGIA